MNKKRSRRVFGLAQGKGTRGRGHPLQVYNEQEKLVVVVKKGNRWRKTY